MGTCKMVFLWVLRTSVRTQEVREIARRGEGRVVRLTMLGFGSALARCAALLLER